MTINSSWLVYMRKFPGFEEVKRTEKPMSKICVVPKTLKISSLQYKVRRYQIVSCLHVKRRRFQNEKDPVCSTKRAGTCQHDLALIKVYGATTPNVSCLHEKRRNFQMKKTLFSILMPVVLPAEIACAPEATPLRRLLKHPRKAQSRRLRSSYLT